MSEPAATPAAPATDRTQLGVVIVTYNSSTHIDDLAASLGPALAGISNRVVAVDNASSDDTVERLRGHGIEVVQVGRNGGYSAGINGGLRVLTDTEAVLLLNPDIVLEPGSAHRMLDVLRDRRVGIVVPQTRSFDGTLAHYHRRDPSLSRAWGTALLGAERVSRIPSLSEEVNDPAAYLQATDLDWGVGSTMLISRTCLDRVGEWDESFFLYSEETDYCQRARRVGFRVRYEPSAVAYHEGGGGVHQPRLRSMMAVNKVRLYRRRHSTFASYLFLAAEVLNEGTRGLMGSKPARAAAVALLFPSRRPPEIKCSESLLPF